MKMGGSERGKRKANDLTKKKKGGGEEVRMRSQFSRSLKIV